MAKIRFGYSDDFTAKNSKVGINTTDSQANLDVVGVVKGQDLKVTGISSQTGYEGFLRADHQIEENTQLNFGQGINASLSGEIIVGTDQTVTVTDTNIEEQFGPELITNGTFDSDASGWTLGAATGTLSASGGELEIQRDSTNGTWCYQAITTEIGALYSVRFTTRSSSGSQITKFTVGSTADSDSQPRLIPRIDTTSTTNVQRFAEFVAKSTTTYIVLGSNYTANSFWDNISVKKHIKSESTTDVNVAGGSQVECMKVYNTFTPPSGDTNQRPSKPKPGQLYYNYDFKTIEFHDGYGWRQVDNTTRSGRAIFSGGATPADVNVIDYYNIHTTGNAMEFGDATLTESRKSGCSSATRGLSAGSDDSGNHEVIDYVTIASEGNAIDFGDMYNGRGTAAGMSSSTRGLWGGGRSPATNQDTIDYVEISTKGDAQDFGDITVARQWLAGCSSSTRGIIAGGENNPFFPSPGRTSRIDFITMASKGDAIIFGDLTAATGNPGGCSNSTRGFFGGGEPRTYSKIDVITIASTGNAIHFGDLTYGRFVVNGAGSQTRATFLGGHSNKNTIDYITMSTGGDAQDFGDLTVGRWSGASFSDCHGGLGGF